MDRGSGQGCDDTVLAKDHILNRRIIRKHGNDSLDIACLGGGSGLYCALRDEVRCLAWRTIINGDLMAGFDEVGGHAVAHLAKT